MLPVTQNLGLVKAIEVGLTPPSNTDMLWYDSNTGVKKHKYYDTVTLSWVLLATSAIPELVLEVTWTGLYNLKYDEQLVPGITYKITDRFNYQSGATGTVPNNTMLGDDRGIVYIKALTVSELSKDVVREMACPKHYDTAVHNSNSWNGVWNINTTGVGLNELVIRGSRVFKNLGIDGTGIAVNENTLDSTNWSLISKSTYINNEYVDKQFLCLYDLDNDWFEEQRDSNDNVIGFGTFKLSYTFNSCDITDWNRGVDYFNNNKCAGGVFNNLSNIVNNVAYTIKDNTGFILNNICPNIYNNYVRAIEDNRATSIYNNTFPGSNIYFNNIKENISGNINVASITYNNCKSIVSNSCSGGIHYNTVTDIDSNSNTGNISNNIIGKDISSNTNNGHITNNIVAGRIALNANTSDITENRTAEDIRENTNNINYIAYNDAFAILSNSNTGSIVFNKVSGSIFSNANLNNISNNTINGRIYNNANTGVIAYNNVNWDIINLDNTCLHYYQNKLSNTDYTTYYEWAIDITATLGGLDLGTFANYLSDVLITSSNSTEVVTDILNIQNGQNVRFRPDSSLTSLTFTHNAAKIRCANATSVVLNGSNSEFITLEKPDNFNAVRQIAVGKY